MSHHFHATAARWNGRGLKPPPTGMVHLWGDWSRAEATSHGAGSPLGEWSRAEATSHGG
ncbi:hypothetical protein BIS09_04300 [Halomonas sp. R1t8]|uniref:hypothetical protein n=1 Tax=unclassified Halomonas TaxID=2609666 RepID=UPI00209DAA2D|nr:MULTISPECIES: hypothetical protein [unclassified Halomonas]MCP1303072.1 hypothetical protein [Halomonas sp. R1t8]MCP1330457.1 hypothetical protein [Halomonas sp. R1t4]